MTGVVGHADSLLHVELLALPQATLVVDEVQP
jgi:hypothetical protein